MVNSYTNSHRNGGASGSINANGGLAADTEGMEGTVELRLMMAYAQRRRPGTVESPQEGGTDTGTIIRPQTPDGTARPKKKRGLKRRLLGCLGCIPQRTEMVEEESPVNTNGVGVRSCQDGGAGDSEDLEGVADKLTRIAEATTFTPGDLETDGEDAVEKLVGLLLREHGDRLNEEVLKDVSLASELLGYSFFEKVLSVFLRRLGLSSDPRPQEASRTGIALTCDVASRLSALDTLPMNRLMGFGAKYLKDHFSPWVLEKGGYGEVFESEDDDEEVH